MIDLSRYYPVSGREELEGNDHCRLLSNIADGLDDPISGMDKEGRERVELLELRVKCLYADAQEVLEHTVNAEDAYCGVVSDLCDDLFNFVSKVDMLREGKWL